MVPKKNINIFFEGKKKKEAKTNLAENLYLSSTKLKTAKRTCMIENFINKPWN